MPALNYTQQFQRHLNWCWAAVTVSIVRFYDPDSTLTQCQFVDQQLDRDDCCQFQFPWHACNSTFQLHVALNAVERLAEFIEHAVTYAHSRDEIDDGHPFGIRVGWLLGGGHFMVCSGYYPGFAGNFLLINDPTFGRSLVRFALFPRLYWGVATWTHTYYTTD